MGRLSGSRVALALLLVVLAVVSARDLSRLGGSVPWARMYEFQDFYCAGDALNHARNPYTYEPLRTCEHAHGHRPIMDASANLAVPAPQPPYDFIPYRALAMLPYSSALTINAVVTVLALFLCAGALSLAGIPFDVAFVALLLPVGFIQLGSGQIAVYAFVFFVGCGAALARGRDDLAGLFGGLVAIEPHVALPVCVALVLFYPRARRSLIATIAVLAVFGLWAVGTHVFAQYVLVVLPAHALAEAANPQQYSATYAAWFLGLPRSAAVLVGNLAYVAAIALGLYAVGVRRDAGAGAERALPVFGLGACAVFGGVFIHAEELMFAIPAALVLGVVCSGTRRWIAASVVCALTIPWVFVWPIKGLFATSLLVCVVLLARLVVSFWRAAALVVALAAVMYAFELHPPELHTAAPSGARYAAAAIAEVEWSDVMGGLQTRDPWWFAIKLPVWLALGALLGVTLQKRYDALNPKTTSLGGPTTPPG